MSVGPRAPAVSESSVCGIRTPCWVVRNSLSCAGTLPVRGLEIGAPGGSAGVLGAAALARVAWRASEPFVGVMVSARAWSAQPPAGRSGLREAAPFASSLTDVRGVLRLRLHRLRRRPGRRPSPTRPRPARSPSGARRASAACSLAVSATLCALWPSSLGGRLEGRLHLGDRLLLAAGRGQEAAGQRAHAEGDEAGGERVALGLRLDGLRGRRDRVADARMRPLRRRRTAPTTPPCVDAAVSSGGVLGPHDGVARPTERLAHGDPAALDHAPGAHPVADRHEVAARASSRCSSRSCLRSSAVLPIPRPP